jgi:hypothetical protein
VASQPPRMRALLLGSSSIQLLESLVLGPSGHQLLKSLLLGPSGSSGASYYLTPAICCTSSSFKASLGTDCCEGFVKDGVVFGTVDGFATMVHVV